ncbi:hypothetical protein WEVI103040_09075 [Weeksella virosa]
MGDLQFYNVNKFKSDDDRSIEDVLKKMPGITVEDNGTIKYKNKEIEKLLLDGDDLFSNQYTNGSRNISANIIEQVQALEHFEENPLLKTVKHSDKVALNLKIKKGMSDISGDAMLGYGIEDRTENTVNALVISNSIKSFSLLTQNNTGVNTSPFDYFGSNQEVSFHKIKDELAPRLVQDPLFNSSVGDERANINKLYYGNTNTIFKLSKNSNFRINYTHLQDRIRFSTQTESDYSFENQEQLSITEENNTQKKTLVNELNAKFTLKKTRFMIENETVYKYEKISSSSDFISNYRENFYTHLTSRNQYFKNHTIFTEKLNNRQSLQLFGLFSLNQLPQDYEIIPGMNLLQNTETTVATSQNSKFTKQFSTVGVNLFGRNKLGKYELSNSLNYWKNSLNSTILEDEILLEDQEFENQINYQILNQNLRAKYSFVWDDWVIENQLNLKNYWLNSQINQKHHLVYNPKLTITYKINPENTINAQIFYDEVPLSEQNIYTSYLITNHRTIQNNILSIEFEKTKGITFSYSMLNMFNQLNISANLDYLSKKNNFFNSIDIKENITRISTFLLDESNNHLNIGTRIQKYYYPIRSNVRFSTNYSWINYKNIVNLSDIRNNITQNINIALYYKSLFNFPLNIENSLQYNYNIHTTKGMSQFNEYQYINNNFKLLIKPSDKLFAHIKWEYYRPNIKSNTNFNFLDFFIEYKIFDDRLKLYIKGKNLLNQNLFNSISTTDYYKYYTSHNLNKRYIMSGIQFSF